MKKKRNDDPARLTPGQKDIARRAREAFSARLLKALEDAGCSRADVARAIGFNPTSLSNYVTAATLPNLRDAFLIAHELNIQPAALFGIPLAVLRGDEEDRIDATRHTAPSANGSGLEAAAQRLADRIFKGVEDRALAIIAERLES